MIYKLKYTTKATAMKDLLKKGVYVETDKGLTYGTGIHAVVEIGQIVLTNGTYGADFKEVTAPVYADGYHFDIMSEQAIDFGSNAIEVNNPKTNLQGIVK